MLGRIIDAIAATILLCAISIGASAEPKPGPVVVELFTSQGCSSCPPADALLTELTKRDDVLPLSIHVDYWDYIGWADRFASPRFTMRQKAYAKSGDRKMVYTPQMIIGGQDDVIGHNARKVEAAIEQHKKRPPSAGLEIMPRSASVFLVRVRALGPSQGDSVIQLVRFMPMAHVEISRGENAGRGLDYSNVVTGWHEIARWDGNTPRDLEVTLEGNDGAAVLIQAKGHGPVLAAARLR